MKFPSYPGAQLLSSLPEGQLLLRVFFASLARTCTNICMHPHCSFLLCTWPSSLLFKLKLYTTETALLRKCRTAFSLQRLRSGEEPHPYLTSHPLMQFMRLAGLCCNKQRCDGLKSKIRRNKIVHKIYNMVKVKYCFRNR